MVDRQINAHLRPNIFGAIIDGISNLFGANSAAESQKDYNEKYLQGVQETNAMNYKIWQEQMAAEKAAAQQSWSWQKEMFGMQNQAQIGMWNMQNAYNDPSAQRQRWENAGFSPWALAQGGNAGTASSMSAPSGSSAPKANIPGAPAMQAPQALQSPLVTSFEQRLAAFTSMTNAALGIFDTYNTKRSTDSGIALNNSQIGVNKETVSGKQWENKFLRDTYESRVGMTKNQARLMDFEAKFKWEHEAEYSAILKGQRVAQDLSNEQQRMLNQWLPIEKQQQFCINAATYANLVKEGIIKERQAVNLLAQQLLINAQTRTENARTGLVNAQTAYTNVQTTNEQVKGDILKIERDQAQALSKGIIKNALLQQSIDELQMHVEYQDAITRRNEHMNHPILYGLLNTVSDMFSYVPKSFGITKLFGK